MSTKNLPSSCSSFGPSKNAANAGQMTKQLMDSIGGSQGCDISSFFADYAAKASGGFGAVSGSVTGSMGGLHKVGCQSINAVVGNFLNSVYTARCLIQNDDTCGKTTVTINQNMNEMASGQGSVIENDCPPGTSRWSETASVQAKIVTSISATTSEHIATVIQQGMQNTAKQAQAITSGFQATDSGAKQANEMQQTLENNSQSTDIKNHITKLINKFNINQNVNAVAIAGGKLINSLPCTWEPNAVMDLQIANIVSSAYSSDVTNSIGAFLKSDMAQKQVIISKGAPDVVGDLFKSGSILEYIAGALIFCIVGYAIYKFQSNKKAKEKLAGLAKGSKLGGLAGDAKLAELAFRFRRR